MEIIYYAAISYYLLQLAGSVINLQNAVDSFKTR